MRINVKHRMLRSRFLLLGVIASVVLGTVGFGLAAPVVNAVTTTTYVTTGGLFSLDAAVAQLFDAGSVVAGSKNSEASANCGPTAATLRAGSAVECGVRYAGHTANVIAYLTADRAAAFHVAMLGAKPNKSATAAVKACAAHATECAPLAALSTYQVVSLNGGHIPTFGAPGFIPCVGGPVAQPKNIILACGDGNAYIDNITWTSWSMKGATGTGVESVNDCTPYCAAGHFHSATATITLSLMNRTHYGILFGHLKITVKKALPGTDQKTVFESLPLAPFS